MITLEIVESLWEERSKWAAEEAARLLPSFPTSELPLKLQEQLNREMMVRHHLSWLELVTGIPHSRFETALGGLPPEQIALTAPPVARVIWEFQGCPEAPTELRTQSGIINANAIWVILYKRRWHILPKLSILDFIDIPFTEHSNGLLGISQGQILKQQLPVVRLLRTTPLTIMALVV